MGYVKDSFKAKADAQSQEIKSLIQQHGEKVLDQVTVAQAYQGMRGIPGLITETSLLDSNEGIRFRGYSIPELQGAIARRTFLPDACRRCAKQGRCRSYLCYMGTPFACT